MVYYYRFGNCHGTLGVKNIDNGLSGTVFHCEFNELVLIPFRELGSG